MKTSKEIIAEMRKDIPRVVDAKVILRNYADRIEEAVTDCNQLKMRSALECIDSIAKYLEAGTIRDVLHAYRNIQDRVRIALSKPPRNCDLYSHDEALRIWSKLPETNKTRCFDEWLYAEKKGETK